jgi:nucleotide-binding universal stress UspA family protein
VVGVTLFQERVVEHGTLRQHAVIVAVDGSRTSMRAADYALGQARRTGTAVIGVFVRQAGTVAVGAPATWVYAEHAQDEVAEEMRDYIAERAKVLGLEHGFVVLSGSPARQIRQLADQLLASAVVVGASEHFTHRFYGSLAVRLARAAHQPVIIVP